MQDWLTDFSAALAVELPGLAVDLPPSPDLAEALLDFARVVAEGTGQKTNAPLSTFMIGRFVGLIAESGVAPEEAVELATKIAGRVLKSRS
jgi:hypothetical protein